MITEKIKSEEQLRSEFCGVVKGTNFMTPSIISYIEIENGVAELSKGTGMSREDIFGVTVVRNGEADHDNSKMFYSMSAARAYINGNCINREFSVWVGGTEVNDYFLSKEEAEKLAEKYKNDGYEDVQIQRN